MLNKHSDFLAFMQKFIQKQTTIVKQGHNKLFHHPDSVHRQAG
jgi:hypothetical protein